MDARRPGKRSDWNGEVLTLLLVHLSETTDTTESSITTKNTFAFFVALCDWRWDNFNTLGTNQDTTVSPRNNLYHISLLINFPDWLILVDVVLILRDFTDSHVCHQTKRPRRRFRSCKLAMGKTILYWNFRVLAAKRVARKSRSTNYRRTGRAGWLVFSCQSSKHQISLIGLSGVAPRSFLSIDWLAGKEPTNQMNERTNPLSQWLSTNVNRPLLLKRSVRGRDRIRALIQSSCIHDIQTDGRPLNVQQLAYVGEQEALLLSSPALLLITAELRESVFVPQAKHTQRLILLLLTSCLWIWTPVSITPQPDVVALQRSLSWRSRWIIAGEGSGKKQGPHIISAISMCPQTPITSLSVPSKLPRNRTSETWSQDALISINFKRVLPHGDTICFCKKDCSNGQRQTLPVCSSDAKTEKLTKNICLVSNKMSKF